MKAHIARNQNAGVPLILGWNLSPADRGKLEGMAPAFGMKVLLVSPADAGKTVAQLLGEVETKAARMAAHRIALVSFILSEPPFSIIAHSAFCFNAGGDCGTVNLAGLSMITDRKRKKLISFGAAEFHVPRHTVDAI